jgi:tRNA-2-methylthio-N6-dimethylallyladenosine synthase
VAKNFFIKTYGCQMNVNDSEMMAGLLLQAGYIQADSPETADVILINTCCVRQRAEDKAIGYALGLVAPKMRKPGRIIGIMGCVAEKDKDELFKKLPFIDLVIGPGQEARVVQLIEQIGSGGEKVAAVGENRGEYPSRSAKRKLSVQAYVNIMFGCDNFCSYCIVPYVRGREKSRPKEEILEEIRGLDKKIFKEVILLGQNVNNYRDQRSEIRDYGLSELLKDVHEIDGIERIRFLTSHPRDMTDDIIDAVKALPKVCEYFHIPLQSGDDEILKKMNRGYTSGQFKDLVGRIRSKIPQAAIASDVIVGFPGETDEQFRNSCDLIKELELDYVNTFVYSPRKGTPAAKMEDNLSGKAKDERLHIIMKAVDDTAGKKNKALEGSIQEILVEHRVGDRQSGRTRGNKLVKFDNTGDLIGKVVRVRITKGGPFVLEGEFVS